MYAITFNWWPVSQCPPVQLIEEIEQVDKETDALKECEVRTEWVFCVRNVE